MQARRAPTHSATVLDSRVVTQRISTSLRVLMVATAMAVVLAAVLATLALTRTTEPEAAPLPAPSPTVGSSPSPSTSTATSTATGPPLHSFDFEDVCTGAPQPRAAAYDKAKPGIHPVLGFGSSPFLPDANLRVPIDIPAGFTRDSYKGENVSEVQLVVCVKRTADTVVKKCPGTKVTMHSGTYRLQLFAAKTGNEIANTTIDLPAAPCRQDPISDVKDEYPFVEDKTVEFIQPHVKTS